MTAHIKNRNKLKDIKLAAEFEALLSRCVLSEEEKQIARLIYVEKQNLWRIGNTLGYSEREIKSKHKAIVDILSAAF